MNQKRETATHMICPPMVDLPASGEEARRVVLIRQSCNITLVELYVAVQPDELPA